MAMNGSDAGSQLTYEGLAHTRWELSEEGVVVSRGGERFLVAWNTITDIEVRHLDLAMRGHIRLAVNGSSSRQPAPGDPFAIVTKGMPLRFGPVNAELDRFADELRSRVTSSVSAVPTGSTSDAPSLLPGWYDDRATRNALRWWDGRGWTPHTERLNEGHQYLPPSWHADPAAPGFERWWNGLGWSDNRRPAAAPAPVPPTQSGRHAAHEEPLPQSAAFATLRPPAEPKPSRVIPYRPPGNLWPATEVMGESNYQTAIGKVLGRLRAGEDREVEADAALVPEPKNRHDPNAVMVQIGGQTVGYLSREDAVAWAPVIKRLVAAGGLLTPKARVWGRYAPDDRGGLFCSVRLALPQPEYAIPLNATPSGPHSIIPWGSRLKVTGDAPELRRLSRFLSRQQEGLLLAVLTTRNETPARGAERVIVDVAVDGTIVGSLTPASSKNIAPLVDHLTGRGLNATAWVTLRGSSLAVDVGVQVAKATEVPEEWLQGPPADLPAFAALS